MNRLLVIAPAWVGDLVMAEPLMRALAARSDDTLVDVLAPASTFPLLSRIEAVDQSFELKVGHGELALGTRYAFGKLLRSGAYREAFVLPNTFKSALIPMWAKARKRTGWHGESRFGVLTDRRRLDEGALPLMIQRYLALAFPADAPPPQVVAPRLAPDVTAAAVLADELAHSSGEPVLALCPGAEFGPSKRWPAQHYASVACAGLAAGYAVWLLGGPGDRGAADEIAQAVPGVCNLVGQTTLPQAVDLLSLVDAVVCNDSGLMHIACALQRKVVALFGSSSPEHTPPMSEAASALTQPLDCAPCFERTCPLGHGNCLQELAPERVISALGLR